MRKVEATSGFLILEDRQSHSSTHSGQGVPLCGNFGITWSILLIQRSMAPHFTCSCKPNSLRKHNSLDSLYEGGIFILVPYLILTAPIGAMGKREELC